MRLSQVNIGPQRYYHRFRLANDSIMVVVALKESFDAILVRDCEFPVFSNATYLGSVAKISFDTVSKDLSDGEYATQVNGYHWVKISGCTVVKIDPEFIKNNN